jgi:hypothetical protein
MLLTDLIGQHVSSERRMALELHTLVIEAEGILGSINKKLEEETDDHGRE